MNFDKMRSLFLGKQIKFQWPYAIALLGGILMGLTPAPVRAWPLAWVALAPLWVLVLQESEKSAVSPHKKRRFYLLPFLWGIGYYGLALFWITGVHPMTWMGVPWLASLAIALFCWVFITLWGAALVCAWAIAIAFIFRTLKPVKEPALKNYSLAFIQVLIGTALWCALESLWSAGPLYWPSLAYTQSPHNLVILQLSQFSGPTVVTGLVVAINGLIAQAWMSSRDRNLASAKHSEAANLQKNHNFRNFPLFSLSKKSVSSLFLILAVTLLTSFHLIGLFLYSRPLVEPESATFKVGIIQGNIPNTIKLYPEGLRRAIEGYTTGYKILAEQGVEAILTPETALPYVWTNQNRQYSSLYQAILDKKILAWVGGFGEESDGSDRVPDLTNSLFTVTGTGEIYSRYDKVKLVPLGEYIPFENILGKLIDRLSPLDAHLIAGSPAQYFDTPFGRAIVGICYESAFAKHFQRQAAAGGEFILTASNNAHYSVTMPAQHHAQDVMRAIESDRWAVRATNTGYSGIVDPHGNTRWISGINTYEIHADKVYRRQTKTLYVRWGDWLTPTLLILSAIAYFWQRIQRVTERSK